MIKTAMISVLVMASVPAFASTRSMCKVKADRADARVRQINDQFGVGEVTRTDVSQVELAAANVKLSCNLILIDDYCKVATDAAKTAYDGVKEEAGAGQRTQLDVMNAQEALDNVAERCQ